MKQKKLNDILYVFDITPYVITQDTDADVIKVQQECYEGYVELNPDLASKIVKYNYHMFTVTQQEWAPYVDADDKPSPELAWSAASATVTIGADDNIFPTLSNPHSVTVSYESSDTTKATINASTGSITLVAEGNTTISAVFAGNDDYAAQTVTYTLTVQQAQPQPLPSPELAWSEESATVTIGESNSFPTLYNPHSVTVSYESSDTTKATIDASTGLITLVAEGNTTISASFAGDSELAPQTVSYALTVQQDQPSVGHTLTLDGSYIHANVNVYFDNVQQTVEYQYQDVAENTVIDIYPTQDPSYYTLNSGATWDTDHWTATMPDADLMISINYDEPASTITVIAPYGLTLFDETAGQAVTMTPVGESEPTEATGTLVVGHTCQIDQSSGAGQNKWPTFTPSCSQGTYGAIGELFTAPATDLTITLASTPNIRYSSNLAVVRIDDVNPTYPTLSNPNGYSVTYGSNNTSVASINQSTGEITLVATGHTNISAMVTSYSGTDQGTGYYLEVNPAADQGVTVTYNVNNTSQAATIWGNNGSVPDQMFVDGESKTVADTYQFSTTGSHTIQYVFNDHILDITFQLSDPTTPVEITGFQVGSDIEEVIGNAWTVKQFDAGASDMVDVAQTYLPTTPPTITGLGESSDRPGATIYVPSNSVSAYQNASVWSDISALIQAIPVQ